MPRWFQHQPKGTPESHPTPSTAADNARTTTAKTTFSYGIKLLHETENSVVDIVFIHGLTGDREKTWTAKKAVAPWPQTLLPQKVVHARILTFGYDANVADWRGMVSKNRIGEHAMNLLTAIATYREDSDTNERPLVFVCHSLGGLVCEDALSLARQRPEQHLLNIFRCTRGIAFLGTPHHGSALAQWAEKLAIAVGLLKQTNQQILAVLKNDSEVLARVQQSFHTMIRSRPQDGLPLIDITCFYEELPLPGVGIVVPSHSAILHGYIPIGIRGNHMDMTKFELVDDPGFIAVAGELRRWVKALGMPSSAAYGAAVSQVQPSNMREVGNREVPTISKALESLSGVLEKIISRANAIRRPIPGNDDLSWFTNTTMYHAWITPARGDPPICSRFIWYAGKDIRIFADTYARSEKLVTTDILYLDCQLATDLTQIVTSAGELLNLTAVGLGMWTLIGQALQDRHSPGLLQALNGLFIPFPEVAEYIEKNGKIPLSVLGKFLGHILNRRPTRDVVIIIDRFGEMEKDDLYILRNVVQDVLDQQRNPESAPTRSIIIGRRDDTTNFVFKGTAEIDEMSEIRECLRALAFEKMDLRRTTLDKADAGTNVWILDCEAFKNWSQDKSAILWIVGKAGSGKSILAGSIRDRFLADINSTISQASENTPIIAAWFYNERESLKSHAHMLRAVLHQILDQDRGFFRHAAPIYRQAGPYDFWNGNLWTMENLKGILEHIVLDETRVRSILLILDGFDESEDNRGRSEDCLSNILSFIRSLIERSTKFKVIFLSRDHSEIEIHLRQHYRIVMQEVNQPDITRVIENGIQLLLNILRENAAREGELNPIRGYNNEPFSHMLQQLQEVEKMAVQEIHDYLLQHADGVILWVKTCLAALEARAQDPFPPLEALAEEVRTLPVSMKHLYQKMVIQLAGSLAMDSKRLAGRAIRWIWKASERRGLFLIEVFDALSIPADVEHALQSTTDPFLRLAGVHTIGAIRRRLLRLCGPFVEITRAHRPLSADEFDDEDQVQLIHQTVKIFLETETDADFLKLPENAHEVVLNESRDYLHVSFPTDHLAYDPLPRMSSIATVENITTVLQYLERKPLFSYIFQEYQELHSTIPARYRSIFEHTTTPPKENIDDLKVIAEMYFHIACSRGWATAVEHLICLQTLSLGDRSSVPDWYQYENSAIQGALRAAIRRQLLPEIRFLAWYVAERGLDLLDFPNLGRDDLLGNSLIVREVLETGNEDIALLVIGYDDENEKESLLAWIQRYKSTAPADVLTLANTQADIRSVQRAIWTVIRFWGSPPKRRHQRRIRSPSSHDDDDDDDDDGDGGGGGGGGDNGDNNKPRNRTEKDVSGKKDGNESKNAGNISGNDPPSSELESYTPFDNYGANISGADIAGAKIYDYVDQSYGANIAATDISAANVSGTEAKSTSGDMLNANTYSTGPGRYPPNQYRVYLDHKFSHTLSRLSLDENPPNQVSILRGGRNLYNPKIPAVPKSGFSVLFGVQESAYLRSKGGILEMRAQPQKQERVSEEDFARRMDIVLGRRHDNVALSDMNKSTNMRTGSLFNNTTRLIPS